MQEFYTPAWWEEYWQKKRHKVKLKTTLNPFTKLMYALTGLFLLIK